MPAPPLVLHVVFRLATGGLENGLVNLINRMPADRYRHAIVCLTQSSVFANRIERGDIPVIALDKRAGKDFGMYRRLWQVLREWKPDIVHTRNLGTLDCMLPAWLSGASCRIHGEHGREISDIQGADRKKIWLRRIHAPLVNAFVAVSCDLQRWLTNTVRIDAGKIVQIYNGVDVARFSPADGPRDRVPLQDFAAPDDFVIGAVGRLDPVKDHLTLLEAFASLLNEQGGQGPRLRLVLVGAGPRSSEYERFVVDNNLQGHVWLAGDRQDVAALLRTFDLFVQPSLAEGISNTILEAMATALPVVATDVGGNAELVEGESTGLLVSSQDVESMARAIRTYVRDPERAIAHGRAARQRVEQRFSLDAMVNGYLNLYDSMMSRGTH